MGKYNITSIKRKVLRSRAFNTQASQRINQTLQRARKRMMEDFDQHPVNRELSQGPNGGNMTNTLGGYGNLFSFIGFGEGSDPVGKVRNLLAQYPKISSRKTGRDKVIYMISIPDIKDFGQVAKMPWESGRSWVASVETGISGFSHYMANVFGESSKSRSGKAIQAKSQIRAGFYKPMPYMSIIINKLIKNISARV